MNGRAYCALAATLVVCLIAPNALSQGLLYIVTSTGDAPLVGSSNFCDSDAATPGDQCTLRAAIQAANLHAGSDGIEFSIPTSDPNYDSLTDRHTIRLTSALPALVEGVQIFGPGAAKLTVRREAAVAFRIFQVTTGGSVTLSGMTMTNGAASDGGGAVQNTNAGTLSIIDCLVSASFGGSGGGGGVHNKSTGTVNLTNSTLVANGGDFVGGLLNQSSGTVNIVNSAIVANTSNRFGGGGILNNGAGIVNITDSSITNNFSGLRGGGGINNSGTGEVNLTRCTVTNNSDGEKGGGIYNSGGTVNIDASTVHGNQAISGGGIFNLAGSLFVKNSTVSQNASTQDSGSGGGLRNEGTSVISNSTFAFNTTKGGGAGISNTGTLFMANCTITGNSSAVTRQFFADDGAGITNVGSGFVQMKSSIVALNVGVAETPDVSGSLGSGGYNLIGKVGSGGGFNGATDQKGTLAAPLDPKLDPNGLQDNGGPTRTVALLFESPAVDQGSSGGLGIPTDQRGAGFVRTFDFAAKANTAGGDGTDIGAFELGEIPTPTPTPTPTPPPPTPTPTPIPTATPVPARLANISTRLRVETGDNVLIGGFIITGTQPKKIIVRAIGPSLPFFNTLANPTLELHGPNGLIDSNDNWIDSPNKQAIMDSTIPPSSDLESAIVATLPANSSGYTAIVRGVSDGTGIGVVEAYDLDSSVDSKLANIATRGFVQTGDDVLIAGTIILGQTAQKIIVRAIGPSLPVAGKLEDPTLELRDGNGAVIRANDNWRTGGQETEIIQSTVPPTNDAESAIVETLQGNGASYTAIVRGVNDTTGIAVVEVYALN